MRSAFASLTARLVVTAVALVAVVVILIGAAASVALHSYLSDRLDDDVVSSLHQLTAGPHPLGAPDDGDGNPFDVQRQGTLTAAATRDWYWGQVSTRSKAESLSRSAVAELTQLTPNGRPQDVSIDGLGEYRVAATAARISLNGGVSGTTGVVAVGLPSKSVDDVVGNLIWWEVLLALLAVAGAGSAATYVVRRQLRPLREVASTAHTVAGLPLAEGEIAIAPRVPEHLTDARTEVGQVGSALNTLLVHVESSLACGSSWRTRRTSCVPR